MNTAMQICQARYDAMLPLDPADTVEAERIWVGNAALELLDGQDVKFQRRMRSPQGVTHEQFAQAVDEYVMANVSSPSVIGRLILAGIRKDASDAHGAAVEAIGAPNARDALFEIASTLLRPLAADGLIAQAEDDEL